MSDSPQESQKRHLSKIRPHGLDPPVRHDQPPSDRLPEQPARFEQVQENLSAGKVRDHEFPVDQVDKAMARAFDIDACMKVVLTPSGADSGADAVNGSAAKPKKPAAQNASRAPVPYLRLLCWLRRVFDRRPILVGAAYIFSFILAPLVRPVFRVIHIQFAVDDGESLRIDRVFVTVLV
jgi:hypothetical protein